MVSIKRINKMKIIGIILILLSIYFLINSLIGLTGNTILETLNQNNYLFMLILFLVGIFILISGGLEEKVKKYDAVIIMGRNWRGYPLKHKVVEGKLDISVPSKMSCKVAAEKYKGGFVDKIIFGTGKSAGQEYPSEAEAMKKYILEKYPEIPPRDIITHENNLDTYEELDEDMKLAKKNKLNKLLLVTVKTQLPRCKKYLENKGEKLDYSSTEEEFEKLGSHYKGLATRYRKSGAVKYERLKEYILGGLQNIGITKGFTKPLAKFIRGSKS